MKTASLIGAMVMVAGVAIFISNESSAKGKTYKIGDQGPAGGWIFYDKGKTSKGWRYLEAAPEDQGLAVVEYGVKWGCEGKNSHAEDEAIGSGKVNTQLIVITCGGYGDTAAEVCTAYRGGDQSDWFLPSKDELNLMYKNLHKKGIGGFSNEDYYCSTECTMGAAYFQKFSDGSQSYMSKAYPNRVRAVRAF